MIQLLRRLLPGLIGSMVFGVLMDLRAADLVVPDSVVFEANVEFSKVDGESLQMNVARPKGASGPFPMVLCIHGGGFRAGTREGYNALCIKLAARGYVAATTSYRLAPKHRFPAAVHDVKTAVRWLRGNATRFGGNPDRIGVLGSSAGGHLAQFLGVTMGLEEFEGTGDGTGGSSRVTCVVNYYGPSDFTQSYGKSVDAAEVLPLFLGGDLTTAREAHIRSSPLNWVTPNAAPTLIIHGTDDKYVAYEQATWMHDRLKACGVEVELLTLEGAGHGFKGQEAERAERATLEFLAKRLK